jgi:hypothetical protein
MSPRQPTPETEDSETSAKDRPGEIHRDEQRDDRGIVYHGDDWDKADEENERGLASDEEITQKFGEDEEDEDVEGHRERDVPDDDVK